jgi:hypothetical protein
MQGAGGKVQGPGQPTRISDLRASLRNANATRTKLPKPPKPRKPPKRESEDERAARAEKQAMAQHTTSLLKGGNSKKPYLRPGERLEKKSSGGLFLQLALVMIVAGGVALALDPSIIPPEWIDRARDLISPYVKI